MIGQILATLLPVFLIAGSGAAYGRFRTPDIRSLNTLNMELFVPLLVFAVLADRQAPLAEYAWLASAAALVVLPVAMQTAETLDVSGQTFAIAVMLGASSSFIAPFEPACILVSGPGKYRFTDYLKAGLGLTLLVGFLVWLMVPIMWGL